MTPELIRERAIHAARQAFDDAMGISPASDQRTAMAWQAAIAAYEAALWQPGDAVEADGRPWLARLGTADPRSRWSGADQTVVACNWGSESGWTMPGQGNLSVVHVCPLPPAPATTDGADELGLAEGHDAKALPPAVPHA